MKPLVEDGWNQDATWNSYTVEEAVSEPTKASQESHDKHKTSSSTTTEQFLRRPVYAKRWNNYEVARNENSKFYTDYVDVRQ